MNRIPMPPSITTRADGSQTLHAADLNDYPDAQAALIDWCTQVGIDGRELLAMDPIHVSADRHRISGYKIVRDDQDHIILDGSGRQPHRKKFGTELEQPAPPWPYALLAIATQERIAPLCTWSDLPEDQCHHCDPTSRPAPPPDKKPKPAMTVAHPVAVQTRISDHQAQTILNKAARALDRDQPATPTDYVDALTTPTTHHEPYTTLTTNPDGDGYWLTARHRTISLPLLEQLASAVATTGAIEGGAHTFASKPAARIDAIDVHQQILTEARSWTRRLGLPLEDKTTGRDVPLEQLIRAAAANAGDDMLRDLRSWWIRARTVTGWDSPSWRPDNTCPLCETKGGLRVRLDAQTAMCIDCGEGWDSSTIGLLADHIRAENGDEVTSEGGTMSA